MLANWHNKHKKIIGRAKLISFVWYKIMEKRENIYSITKSIRLDDIETFHKIGLGNADEVQYNVGILLSDDTYIELASLLKYDELIDFMNKLNYDNYEEFYYIQDSFKERVTILLYLGKLEYALKHFKDYYEVIRWECFDEDFMELLETEYYNEIMK